MCFVLAGTLWKGRVEHRSVNYFLLIITPKAELVLK